MIVNIEQVVVIHIDCLSSKEFRMNLVAVRFIKQKFYQ
jgi:hypothetical protein